MASQIENPSGSRDQFLSVLSWRDSADHNKRKCYRLLHLGLYAQFVTNDLELARDYYRQARHHEEIAIIPFLLGLTYQDQVSDDSQSDQKQAQECFNQAEVLGLIPEQGHEIQEILRRRVQGRDDVVLSIQKTQVQQLSQPYILPGILDYLTRTVTDIPEHPIANLLLGQYYLEGMGVKKNIEHALHYFEKALSEGVGDAAYYIAKIKLEQMKSSKIRNNIIRLRAEALKLLETHKEKSSLANILFLFFTKDFEMLEALAQSYRLQNNPLAINAYYYLALLANLQNLDKRFISKCALYCQAAISSADPKTLITADAIEAIRFVACVTASKDPENQHSMLRANTIRFPNVTIEMWILLAEHGDENALLQLAEKAVIRDDFIPATLYGKALPDPIIACQLYIRLLENDHCSEMALRKAEEFFSVRPVLSTEMANRSYDYFLEIYQLRRALLLLRSLAIEEAEQREVLVTQIATAHHKLSTFYQQNRSSMCYLCLIGNLDTPIHQFNEAYVSEGGEALLLAKLSTAAPRSFTSTTSFQVFCKLLSEDRSDSQETVRLRYEFAYYFIRSSKAMSALRILHLFDDPIKLTSEQRYELACFYMASAIDLSRKKNQGIYRPVEIAETDIEDDSTIMDTPVTVPYLMQYALRYFTFGLNVNELTETMLFHFKRLGMQTEQLDFELKSLSEYHVEVMQCREVIETEAPRIVLSYMTEELFRLPMLQQFAMLNDVDILAATYCFYPNEIMLAAILASAFLRKELFNQLKQVDHFEKILTVAQFKDMLHWCEGIDLSMLACKELIRAKVTIPEMRESAPVVHAILSQNALYSLPSNLYCARLTLLSYRQGDLQTAFQYAKNLVLTRLPEEQCYKLAFFYFDCYGLSLAQLAPMLGIDVLASWGDAEKNACLLQCRNIIKERCQICLAKARDEDESDNDREFLAMDHFFKGKDCVIQCQGVGPSEESVVALNPFYLNPEDCFQLSLYCVSAGSVEFARGPELAAKFLHVIQLEQLNIEKLQILYQESPELVLWYLCRQLDEAWFSAYQKEHDGCSAMSAIVAYRQENIAEVDLFNVSEASPHRARYYLSQLIYQHRQDFMLSNHQVEFLFSEINAYQLQAVAFIRAAGEENQPNLLERAVTRFQNVIRLLDRDFRQKINPPQLAILVKFFHQIGQNDDMLALLLPDTQVGQRKVVFEHSYLAPFSSLLISKLSQSEEPQNHQARLSQLLGSEEIARDIMDMLYSHRLAQGPRKR